MISSSDELATRPDVKPAPVLRFWERRTNWYRIAEFEAALFCFLAALSLLFVADLTDTAIAHRWMLALGSEPAWIFAFAAFSVVTLIGAMSRPGVLRSGCLLAAIWFFSCLAAASFHAHALAISSCAFLANAAALAVSFWRRYE